MLFWLLSTLLAVIVIIAVLRPLFKSEANRPIAEDQLRISIYQENLHELDKEFDKGLLDDKQLINVKHELELSLLKESAASEHNYSESAEQQPVKNNRITAVVLSLLIIGGALSLYQQIGNPQLTTLKEFSLALANIEQDEPPPLREVMVPLKQHLDKNPADANGWLLLANVYTAVAEYDLAVGAYEKLYAMAGDNTELLLQYVNALVRANNGSFQGRVGELLQRILQLDPGNYTAHFYAGLAADEAGNYKQANDHYYLIVPVLQNNPELLQTVNFLIARNEQLMAITQSDLPAESVDTIQPPSSVALHVTVTDELLGKFGPEDTLFVYAQALEGSPMPLAVVRKLAGDLPVNLTLDDSMAMTPAMKLSGFDKVRLLARISKSGNAQPESGDLTGIVAEVDVKGSEIINLVIDKIVP